VMISIKQPYTILQNVTSLTCCTYRVKLSEPTTKPGTTTKPKPRHINLALVSDDGAVEHAR
jgi:hypothetical protein